jgi:hypothetical protein
MPVRAGFLILGPGPLVPRVPSLWGSAKRTVKQRQEASGSPIIQITVPSTNDTDLQIF